MLSSELTLSLFHFSNQPVLVLQELPSSEALLLHTDGSYTHSKMPNEPIRPGFTKLTADILKQVLFIPREIDVYQRQSAKVLTDLAENGFREQCNLEDALRVRLLPLVLALESGKRSLLPEYESSLGQVIARYFRDVTPAATRMLESWEDVSAAVNYFAERTEEKMKKVLKTALEAGLTRYMLDAMQWVEADMIVMLELRLMKTHVEAANLGEAFCQTLLNRVSNTPKVYCLLKTALEFADTPDLQQKNVTLSLQYLLPAFKERLNDSQKALISALIMKCTDLLLGANIPLQMLFADTETTPAARYLVVRHIIKETRTYESIKCELKDEVLAGCFNKDTLKDVILAKKWRFLSSLRNIDTLLNTYLRLLLEQLAPENLLIFQNLEGSIDEITKASITFSRKEAALSLCLSRGKHNEAEKKRVGVKAGLIRYRSSIFAFLFVREKTRMIRVPRVVTKVILVEFLYRSPKV